MVIEKALKGFQNTFLIFLKAVLILLLLVVFYCGYLPYSHELRRFFFMGMNRVTTIMGSTFILTCYVMMRLYGGFSVGKRRTKELCLSMSLAVGVTDAFTFLQLCIMEKVIMPIWVLGIIFVIQILIVTVVTKFANNLFFAFTPPRKLLIIYDIDVTGEEELKDTLRRLKSYQNRFTVERVISVNEGGIHTAIKGSGAVLFLNMENSDRAELMEYCYKKDKPIFFTPRISDLIVNAANHFLFDDLSVFGQEKRNFSLEERFLKRFLDLAVTIPMVILLSPVMLLEGLVIWMCDRGPIFYRQQRMTRNGRFFHVLKFRTMRVDAEQENGAILATHNDPRITAIGGLLRKTRLDELPQLLNVLRGDMSLIGPRPERPEMLVSFEKDLPEFCYRLNVKAGITGLAQVLGRYDTSPKDKLILDLYYIQNYSLRLDLKILFQTLVVCLTPERAN